MPDSEGMGKSPDYRRESAATYDDLRKLEAAIREAYVAKELKAQILESEAAWIAARARERLREQTSHRELRELEKISEKDKEEQKLARVSYGVELQSAASSRLASKASALEEERRERRMLEKIFEFIEEKQKAAKISERQASAHKMSRELQIFREIREIRLQKESEKREIERRRDCADLKKIDDRIETLKQAREEEKIAREAVIEIVSRSLLESREKKLKIESMIADLVADEKLFEEEMRLRRDEERRKAAGEEAAVEVERHRIIVEEKKLRNEIREEEFAIEVMRRVIEDRRTARLTIEARRRRQVDYRKSLEEIIKERKARRDLEIVKLEESLRVERRRNDDYRGLMKELRRKLITDHALNVADFIARKALSDEEKMYFDKIICESDR